MIQFVKLLQLLGCYTLCLIYSTWFAIKVTITFIFNRESKFWEVKDRTESPEILSRAEFGEHKFAKINGIKIHYVEKGDPSKPLLLFVHGFPEFWFSWRYQLKEFSKDYWCVAIDQRGYGDSEKPSSISDYNIDNMVSDIREVVKHLGREKFILICHDWGSAIGFRYVLKHMDTLDKYVMIGAPPYEVWNQMITKSVKQFMMSWYVFFFQMPYLPEFCLRTYDMKSFDIMSHMTDEEMEAYKYTFGKNGAFTGPINYYRAASLLFYKSLNRPSKFAPGLYMLGEFDNYIGKSSGKRIKKLYDNLEFKVIKGTNHFAQHYEPKETNRLMREFLENK